VGKIDRKLLRSRVSEKESERPTSAARTALSHGA
jgi:hypothetical protein